MGTKPVYVQDGYESQFQANYLGHFLLAYLLRDILEATGMPYHAAPPQLE
jgi:hypothetical protein